MIAFGALASATAVIGAALTFLGAPSPPMRAARHPDAVALAVALPGWTIWQWELLRGGVAIAAVIVGLPIAVIALSVVAPSVAIRQRVATIRGRDAAAVTTLLQRVHATLRSGISLDTSLRRALDDTPPTLRAPFARALRSFDLGVGLADGLEREVATAGVDQRVTVALDALALVAREELPASRAAGLVGAAAERLAFEQRVREEVDARASGIHWQITVLALLVPALAGYLALTMPGLASTLASPLGTRVLVPIAALLEVSGIVASRAMVRGLAL